MTPEAMAVAGTAVTRRTVPRGAHRLRRLQLALGLVGAGLFVYLLVQIGTGSIVASFEQLSWRLAVIVVFPCTLGIAFDVLGWKFAFSHDRVSFLTLVRARLAGHAINATTPTGTLGGDAVKAWLLRDDVSLRETLASLIVVKTTMTASQAIFLLLGILVARQILPQHSPFVRGMEVLLALETIAVTGFVAAQMAGVMVGGHRILERFGFGGGERARSAISHIDQALATFYRRQPRRLGLSVGCNLVGWVASAGETWFILYCLGQAVAPATAIVIEAFGMSIRFAAFLVPAQIGLMEGGAVATFLALGLNGATGLSFSLVRRVRELLWTGVGLFLLSRSPIPSLRGASAPLT